MQQFIITLNDLADIHEKFESANNYIKEISAESVLVHCFIGNWCSDDTKKLIEKIQSELPNAKIIGTISCGEIVNGESSEVNYMLTVSVFEKTQVEVFAYNLNRGDEKKIGEEISNMIDSHEKTRAVEFFSTVLQFNSQLLLESISPKNKNVAVFGAGAMGSIKPGECFLFADNEFITSGLVLAIYQGDDFYVQIEHIFGWKPLGREMEVTEYSDLLLKKIDNKSAYIIYQHYLQIPYAENFLEHTLGFPILSKDRGVDVLRVSHGTKSDGSIILSAPIPTGTKIRITYGNLSEIFHEVEMSREVIWRFVPQAIYLYDCATRKMFWQDGVNQELLPFQKVAPTAGFFCEGEFKSSYSGEIINHQCTLLAIGMREGLAGKPVKIKKSAPGKFYTDSDILKRMATFVQMTTLDLENANKKLIALNRDLNVANAKLSYIAITDELTKLFNRRELEQRLQFSIKVTKTKKSPLSLIMIDIDFFKKVNDTYGHAVGDQVIREAAEVIRASLEDFYGAFAGRWGGEEFLVVLPDVNIIAAKEIAEKIRVTFANHKFILAGHQTLSLGVTCTYGDEDEKKIFIRADDALYRAKSGGRNKVVTSDIQ